MLVPFTVMGFFVMFEMSTNQQVNPENRKSLLNVLGCLPTLSEHPMVSLLQDAMPDMMPAISSMFNSASSASMLNTIMSDPQFQLKEGETFDVNSIDLGKQMGKLISGGYVQQAMSQMQLPAAATGLVSDLLSQSVGSNGEFDFSKVQSALAQSGMPPILPSTVVVA